MSHSVELTAKDHFINVAAGDIPAAVEELSKAAVGGMILMGKMDYHILFRAAQKYLGKDTYDEQITAEWNALSTEEKDAIRANEERYGKFGLVDVISGEEVPLALFVAAKLLSKDFKMGAADAQSLRDPEIVKSITKRFPIIRAADIAEALEIN